MIYYRMTHGDKQKAVDLWTNNSLLSKFTRKGIGRKIWKWLCMIKRGQILLDRKWKLRCLSRRQAELIHSSMYKVAKTHKSNSIEINRIHAKL